jgi:hypothetical protein
VGGDSKTVVVVCSFSNKPGAEAADKGQDDVFGSVLYDLWPL